MTDTHRHEWHFITDGPDCDECIYSAVIAIAKCECGEMMGPSQMERKLSAVEHFSKTSALAAHLTTRNSGDWVSAKDLLNYAEALEGDDAQA